MILEHNEDIVDVASRASRASSIATRQSETDLDHGKVDLKQFQCISRDVTEHDKGLAVIKRVVAPEPCFHNR